MDRNNIAVCVSLDGKLGSQLDEHIAYLWKKYRDRFVVYANVDWQGDGTKDDPASWACHRSGFAERTANAMREAVKRGVSGLKIFKAFGLTYPQCRRNSHQDRRPEMGSDLVGLR